MRTLASPRCRLIVVKATERCNLNCSYCYMFNGGDQSYMRRPPVMSEAVSDAMFRRVRAHCSAHGIDSFTFVLHGGEPMVAPPKFYRRFVERARQVLEPDVAVRFAMQTNGTLMSEEWCSALRDLDIGLSFSIDGPRADHDRYRVDRRGRGSFDRVMQGWNLAVASGLRPGALVVVNLQSDPIATYDLLKTMQPSTVDFLLPDATHDKPPAGLAPGGTSYADWLLTIFRCWQAEGGGGLKIRLFLQLMRSLVGKQEGYDILGRGEIEVLVVETDGEIQPLDGLRVCADGIADTPYNVLRNELDDAYSLPLIRQYHSAHHSLPDTCTQCRLVEVCGGGFLAHRFQLQNGFDNPSVYCADLQKLILEVHKWLAPRLPMPAREQLVIKDVPAFKPPTSGKVAEAGSSRSAVIPIVPAPVSGLHA
jgi:uncharacterized protein